MNSSRSILSQARSLEEVGGLYSFLASSFDQDWTLSSVSDRKQTSFLSSEGSFIVILSWSVCDWPAELANNQFYSIFLLSYSSGLRIILVQRTSISSLMGSFISRIFKSRNWKSYQTWLRSGTSLFSPALHKTCMRDSFWSKIMALSSALDVLPTLQKRLANSLNTKSTNW